MALADLASTVASVATARRAPCPLIVAAEMAESVEVGWTAGMAEAATACVLCRRVVLVARVVVLAAASAAW